jgi:Protein of unknown function (DUF3443)
LNVSTTGSVAPLSATDGPTFTPASILVVSILFVSILGLLLAACSGSTNGPTSGHEASPATGVVPIAIAGGGGSALGVRPLVEIRVGRSEQVPVLLDTGSVGLHIFAPAVSTGRGSGVVLTSTPQSITYSGGMRFTGVEASSVLTIGSYSTASPVPFALVEHASCTTAKPDCATADGMSEEIAAGEYGILGIGIHEAPSGLWSPLLAMPGPLGRSWSIHLTGRSGSFVLGARVPTAAAETTIHLRSQGATPHGRYWADADVSLCLSVGTVRTCAPSLFDTGTSAVQLTGEEFAEVPLTPGTLDVVPGTKVAVSGAAASEPFWTFDTGPAGSGDSVFVHRGARAFVNCSVEAFYTFTIVYDDTDGTITLVPST